MSQLNGTFLTVEPHMFNKGTYTYVHYPIPRNTRLKNRGLFKFNPRLGKTKNSVKLCKNIPYLCLTLFLLLACGITNTKVFNWISKIICKSFFTPRIIITKYNLQGSALNVVQPRYNNLIMHNPFLYMIAHMWNQLPAISKFSTNLAQFRAHLINVIFTECQCMTYI